MAPPGSSIPLLEGLISGVAEALRQPTWIVHGGRWDMEVLNRALGGLPARILDTQIGAGLCSEWWPAPYVALVRDHLGEEVDKSATLSDWSRRPLTAEQLAYAAADVELLFPLWDAIAAQLADRDRMDLAFGACDEARQRVLDPPDPDTAWRRIAARAALEPVSLTVLQELAAWRQERAVARNQPERSILSDGAMIELAKRRPLTPAALAANRRMPRSVQKSSDELLDRIVRATKRPDWARPRAVRRRTPEWNQVAWLDVWSAALGAQQTFAPALVLPRSLLEDVVLASSPGAVADLLAGWRTPLVAQPLEDALAGRVSLTLRDGTLRLAHP